MSGLSVERSILFYRLPYSIQGLDIFRTEQITLEGIYDYQDLPAQSRSHLESLFSGSPLSTPWVMRTWSLWSGITKIDRIGKVVVAGWSPVAHKLPLLWCCIDEDLEKSSVLAFQMWIFKDDIINPTSPIGGRLAKHPENSRASELIRKYLGQNVLDDYMRESFYERSKDTSPGY